MSEVLTKNEESIKIERIVKFHRSFDEDEPRERRRLDWA